MDRLRQNYRFVLTYASISNELKVNNKFFLACVPRKRPLSRPILCLSEAGNIENGITLIFPQQ